MEHNQLTIKTFVAIMAERDAAIRERNMALEERKRAFAERDMAILQRDAALAERNSAIQERNEAISTLHFQAASMDDNHITTNPNLPENRAIQGGKCTHNDHQMNHMFDLAEAKYDPMNDSNMTNPNLPIETVKPRKVKETKPVKLRRVGPKGGEGSNKQITNPTLNDWENEQNFGGDDENPENRHVVVWNDNLGLNQVNFDESAMPVPVCSCTGVPQPCYKWGNGGWQSACCTTNMSMYPLPQASNKRYSRIGGRKMSGSVFTKLLNRLANEGHDLSTPLDLKDHWAKHGTNRYSTLK